MYQRTVVFAGKRDAGVNVTIIFVESTEYVPATWTYPAVGSCAKTGMVAGPTTARVIGSLVTITIDEFTATPAAPLTGLMLTTVGPVLSAVDDADVVKLLLKGTIVCAARSRRPLTLTMYDVDGDSGNAGVKVNVV